MQVVVDLVKSSPISRTQLIYFYSQYFLPLCNHCVIDGRLCIPAVLPRSCKATLRSPAKAILVSPYSFERFTTNRSRATHLQRNAQLMHDSCSHFSKLPQRYNNSDHPTFLRDSRSVRESLKQHYLKVICFVRELARLLYIIFRVKIICVCQALYRGNAPVLIDNINILTKYLEVGMEPLPYVVCWKHRSSCICKSRFFAP